MMHENVRRKKKMTANNWMQQNIQNAIRSNLDVKQQIDVSAEITKRVNFIKSYMCLSGSKTLVLGISGGVDSLTAGLLAQKAVNELNSELNHNFEAAFYAVRLPYGEQADEIDATLSMSTINASNEITVNIKAATDAAFDSLGLSLNSVDADFVRGNIKARQRMIAQYSIAGATKGLVIGTDHAAEALMGFFTKFGDGAADITPLAGLNKRQVRQLAKALGAPDSLVYKTPTADLESLCPGKPDEDAFGVSYDEIDDFLEGKEISEESFNIIVSQYNKTTHKRIQPIGPK